MSSNILLLILLAVVWGPSFLFIKVAVSEISPLTMVAIRVGIAALVLYGILRFRGETLPKIGQGMWRHFALLGLLAHALPFSLFSWGEIYIDSAIASILNGTTPLFTMMIAHMFIVEERMTFSKIIGAVVGFQGLIMLIYPSLIGGFQATTFGLLATTVAAFSYGIAMVYARLKLRGLSPLLAPTAQLIMATIYMVPIALVVERPLLLAFPSWSAVGSVIVLAVLGTSIGFFLYYKILERAGATYLSMVTYLVPVFGVLLGVTVLDEQLTWNAYLGCLLILLGVMVANGILKLPQRQPIIANELSCKPKTREGVS